MTISIEYNQLETLQDGHRAVVFSCSKDVHIYTSTSGVHPRYPYKIVSLEKAKELKPDGKIIMYL